MLVLLARVGLLGRLAFRRGRSLGRLADDILTGRNRCPIFTLAATALAATHPSVQSCSLSVKLRVTSKRAVVCRTLSEPAVSFFR